MSPAPAPDPRVTVSVRRERMPRPGAWPAPWKWDDVLDAEPPSASADARASEFVVRHGFDERDADPEARVGYASVVRTRVDAAGAVRVRVDERVSVEPRVLAPVLVAERALHRGMTATSEAGARFVTAGGERLSRHVQSDRGQVIVRRGTTATVGAWTWLTRVLAEAVGALVAAPDRFWASATAADAHLASRRERRAIVRGFTAPHALSREGKGVALFLAGVALLLAVLVVHVAVTLARPELAGEWRSLVAHFGLAVASTLVFPFFLEFRVPVLAAEVGGFAAVTSIVLGMLVGAWMVLFLGDEIHGALKRSVRAGSPVSRLLDRAEAFAGKHGFWTACGALAIPGGPDTLVFYTLATVRTPLWKYLAGAAVGLTLRFTLVLVAAERVPLVLT